MRKLALISLLLVLALLLTSCKIKIFGVDVGPEEVDIPLHPDEQAQKEKEAREQAQEQAEAERWWAEQKAIAANRLGMTVEEYDATAQQRAAQALGWPALWVPVAQGCKDSVSQEDQGLVSVQDEAGILPKREDQQVRSWADVREALDPACAKAINDVEQQYQEMLADLEEFGQRMDAEQELREQEIQAAKEEAEETSIPLDPRPARECVSSSGLKFSVVDSCRTKVAIDVNVCDTGSPGAYRSIQKTCADIYHETGVPHACVDPEDSLPFEQRSNGAYCAPIE